MGKGSKSKKGKRKREREKVQDIYRDVDSKFFEFEFGSPFFPLSRIKYGFGSSGPLFLFKKQADRYT
jgi:hypothetical protein